MRDLLLVASVFLACAVEAVEALTIVLAVGTTRGWRSTWYGASSAAVVLAAFVGVLGPSLSALPIDGLRVVVGTLLLIVGLQWLRKAVLRASGFKDLRDEAAAYDRGVSEARSAVRSRRGLVDDWYSFTVAFKGVLLEGLEVAVIVVTFGANQHSVPLAVAGAAAAIVVVAVAGVAVRRPLARVPENTMKLVVGVMLTSFGTFWSAQGAGVSWPGSDAALLAVVGVTAVLALGLTRLLQVLNARIPRAHPADGA